jgi:MFS transporter, MHS family, proline/betaine transporter
MKLFNKALPKEVWIGWLSSAVEAYNMAIYSFTAPLLATQIFHHTPPSRAILYSYFLVLIASCLIYPLGATYYGFLGDRLGRQKTCVYSTLGLAVATGLIGFAPLHFLGNHTWIYLLLCICAQHFFSGGEYHGSIVFSLEHAEKKRGGLMSALSCLFAVFGLISASGLATLSYSATWWIQIAFFAGAIGGLLSYLLKKYCRETPAFTALSQNLPSHISRIAFIQSLRQNIGPSVATLAFFIVSYTFVFITLPLIHLGTTPTSTFRSLIVYGLSLVLAGWIADRIGIQRMILIGLCLFSLAIFPLCHLCTHLQTLQIALTICASFVIGPIHAWMLRQFEVKNRCRGIFVSSALATVIFGGTTTPICLMLFEKFHSLAVCAIYPLIIALSTLIYLLLHTRTSDQYTAAETE